jgi:hypothetical protein
MEASAFVCKVARVIPLTMALIKQDGDLSILIRNMDEMERYLLISLIIEGATEKVLQSVVPRWFGKLEKLEFFEILKKLF